MNTELIVAAVSTVVAVACVVYARVKGNTAADFVSQARDAIGEIKTLRDDIRSDVASLQEPLGKAIAELPKRRTKKTEGDTAGGEPS
jgi:type VI protein secretion system component VasK